ncbi:MAG TPA: hypothetical protein VFC78_02790 [Tepidisphaeraceae bacterium]|nr:hypothetical protein [Tepidisphaeraceae bacterium]
MKQQFRDSFRALMRDLQPYRTRFKVKRNLRGLNIFSAKPLPSELLARIEPFNRLIARRCIRNPRQTLPVASYASGHTNVG